MLRRARRIREKIYLAANMSVEFDLGGEDAVEDRLEQKSIVTRKLYSRGSTRVGGRNEFVSWFYRVLGL